MIQYSGNGKGWRKLRLYKRIKVYTYKKMKKKISCKGTRVEAKKVGNDFGLIQARKHEFGTRRVVIGEVRIGQRLDIF